MFSSTTIASSMTMPTDSVSASIVSMLSVKPMVPHQAERGDDRGRDRDRGDDRRAEVAEEQQHDERRENRADDQMLLDVVDRRFDELRLIADDAGVVAGRQRRPQLLEALLDGVDHFDGVGARLPADVEQHRARAVDVGDGVDVGFAVLDARDVADPHRMAVLLADHDVVELGDALDAAARPQRERLRALIDAAAGNLDVLRLQRARRRR